MTFGEYVTQYVYVALCPLQMSVLTWTAWMVGLWDAQIRSCTIGVLLDKARKTTERHRKTSDLLGLLSD